MICKYIDEITIENNTTKHKQKLEQLEIEYLLCNTGNNAYITEITKKIKLMENNKHEEKNETYEVNMIINLQIIFKMHCEFVHFANNMTCIKLASKKIDVLRSN
jgi:hypothetical protein